MLVVIMSKGSAQRPLQIKKSTFDANFERIFGKSSDKKLENEVRSHDKQAKKRVI